MNAGSTFTPPKSFSRNDVMAVLKRLVELDFVAGIFE
jgi:hypothetical protein